MRPLLLPIAACLALCGCYDRHETPRTTSKAGAPNARIETLRENYRGHVVRIDDAIRIAGRVTSCDREGNFYKSLVVEDATGAVELMAGLLNLHADYPEGIRLCIEVQGCALGMSRGVLQIGQMPPDYDDYAVDYIASRVRLDALVRSDDTPQPLVPRRVAIDELDEELCGRLVRIEGVRVLPPEDPEAPDTWSGYRTFADAAGATITLYTSPYARFADHTVPAGEVSLTGILQYGPGTPEGTGFLLKMRYERDCEIRH